jgi:hypothetical protein
LFSALLPSVKAAGIISCYAASNTAAVPTTATACLSQVNFNDTLQWNSSAIGLPMDSNTNSSFTPGPGTPWIVPSSGNAWGVLGVGVNAGPGFSGSALLLETFESGRVYNTGGANWAKLTSVGIRAFEGHFNSSSDPLSPTTAGDYVMGFAAAAGPMQLSFDSPIGALGFYISTRSGFPSTTNPGTRPVDATIRAYTLDPLLGGVPILSYRVTDTGGGGMCASLNTVTGQPIPCNDAPFIGINGGGQLFNYITITTTDSTGFFISSLAIEEVPEPAPGFLIGGGVLLLAMASRKLRARA